MNPAKKILRKVQKKVDNVIFERATAGAGALVEPSRIRHEEYDNYLLETVPEYLPEEVKKQFREFFSMVKTCKADLYEVKGEVVTNAENGLIFQGSHVLNKPYFFASKDIPAVRRQMVKGALGKVNASRKPAPLPGKVVVLRHVFENNYYHFFHDILPLLGFVQESLPVDDATLLVGRSLWDKPYFQEVIKDPKLPLSKYQWRPQRDDVSSEDTVFVVRHTSFKPDYDKVLEMLQVPTKTEGPGRKIFLNRGKKQGRNIQNFEEVQALMEEFAYESVDTNGWTLQQQIETFSQASQVVGIHGAGMINLLFRAGQPCQVVEIFPPGNCPGHYYRICHFYGYHYDAVVGTREDEGGQVHHYSDFQVSIADLRAKLEAMQGQEVPASAA